MLNETDHLTHQRWLADNGFINDLHKDSLYMYGAICHRDIRAVQVDIDVEKKTVGYELYITKKLEKTIQKFNVLSKSKSLIGLWRFKRLLTSEGNLNFYGILNKFVKDYLGPKWTVVVQVKDFDAYEEGFTQVREINSRADQSIDG